MMDDVKARQQVRAGVQATMAIAEAIRDLGEVPNGELYARLMQYMDFTTYEGIIDVLKSSGVVTESANMLKWKGVN